MNKSKRRFGDEEKATIVLRHLKGKEEVSDRNCLSDRINIIVGKKNLSRDI